MDIARLGLLLTGEVGFDIAFLALTLWNNASDVLILSQFKYVKLVSGVNEADTD